MKYSELEIDGYKFEIVVDHESIEIDRSKRRIELKLFHQKVLSDVFQVEAKLLGEIIINRVAYSPTFVMGLKGNKLQYICISEAMTDAARKKFKDKFEPKITEYVESNITDIVKFSRKTSIERSLARLEDWKIALNASIAEVETAATEIKNLNYSER